MKFSTLNGAKRASSSVSRCMNHTLRNNRSSCNAYVLNATDRLGLQQTSCRCLSGSTRSRHYFRTHVLDGLRFRTVSTYYETKSRPSISDIYHNPFDSGITSHSPPQDYELTLLQSLAYTRAFESETAVVMVNAGGPVAEGYIGGSGVWMPFKGMLGGVGVSGGPDDGKTEGMRVVQVDLSVLRDSRRTYQIRTDQVGKIGSL